MAGKHQIFVDESGRRKKIINLALLLFIAFTLSSAVLITYSVNKLNRISNIARNDTIVAHADMPMAMLYNDNHERAYSIASAQISKVKTVMVPRYILNSNGYESPEYYISLNDDIEFLSENKVVSYNKYFILSSKRYTDLPLERKSKPEIDSRLHQLIDSTTLENIINDIRAAHGHGLAIELDSRMVTSPDDISKLSAWVVSTKNKLDAHQLSFGLMLKSGDHNDIILGEANQFDVVYISQNYDASSRGSYQTLAKKLYTIPGQIILELPTVSSRLDFADPNQYNRSVEYSSVQDSLIDRNISERSDGPIKLDTATSRHVIYDAVSGYNFMRLSEAEKSAHNAVSRLQYAVANPGFEEYSIWNVLSGYFDATKVDHVLTKQVTGSQKVTKQGAGQVFKVENTGTPGTRTLAYNSDKLVISSQLQSNGIDPVVVASGKKQNKIALTFDDGPHPVTTRKVLDILDSNGVKGTFFALGEKVRASPSTAREIVTRGHELENHSFSHPIFSKIDAKSQANQIEATNKIIKDVTGETPKYFRKPYSDNGPINTSNEIEYLAMLQQFGLLSSEYDIDSKDWELGSADEVVQKVIRDIEASNGSYSQILFHDIHSRPEITFEALPRVIQYLKSKNIEIVRVDQLTESEPQVAGVTTTYRALTLRDGWARAVIYVNLVILGFAILKYAWMLFGTLAYHLFRRIQLSRTKRYRPSRRLPTVAVIIACYNEEAVIGKTIEALFNNTYKKFKIVVINDGSKDNTLKILKAYARKDKRLSVIDIPNGGKANALSLAIRKTRNRWLIFCDADTVFAPDALERFAKEAVKDPMIGAIAGNIKVGNDHNLLTRSQFIEYSMSHMFIKTAQDLINSIIVVPGALGLWRRDVLMKIGGFTNDTLAEDADATMKVIAAGYRVKYISNIGARTEAPEKVSQLMTQRTRWQLGNMQALFKHSRGLFNYRYKLLGYVGLPMFYIELVGAIFFPVLLVFSLTILAYFILGMTLPVPAELEFITNPGFVAVSSSIIILEIATTIFAIFRDAQSRKSAMKLVLILPFYIIIYKTILSYATLVSFLRALRGTMHGWGTLKRTASVQ